MLGLSTLAASNHAETRASSMTSIRSRSEVKRDAGRDGRTAGPAPDVLLGGSAASSRDPQISYRRVWVGDLGMSTACASGSRTFSGSGLIIGISTVVRGSWPLASSP